ncbi:DNA-binding response regulator [Bacteroidia bacterium]|nr:DNA-binding response regulator [Bacteroidia bacterium]GHV70368.1 DNA-binding response regulator [Bacteroidia bacterium]
MIKLLLIEDDANLGYIVKSSLEEIIGGYEVCIAENGEEGLSLFKSFGPDMIVSDIEMPVLNGLETIKKIRETNQDIPVIFATSKTTARDVTTGYDIGANNYIKKPFLPEELDAHIKALIHLRNNNKTRAKNALHKIGEYVFDPKNHFLIYDSDRQILTAKESQILELLLGNKGEIIKRDEILSKLWETGDFFFNSRSLDVFISKIRNYLSKDKSIRITNVKGVGLILDFD